MKQTAVEWLINKFKKSKHYQQMINEVHQNSTVAIDVIEQAKAMEKDEKLKNQLFKGKVSEIIGCSKVIELVKECNETFKQD